LKKSIKLWLILAIVALLAVVVPAVVLLPGCTISDESSSSSTSFGTVAGIVSDADTGNGIYDAKVKVVVSTTSSARAVYSAQTDSNGNYSIPDIPSGTHEIVASKRGYQNVTRNTTVQAGATTSENFTMTAVAGGTISGRVSNAADSTKVIGARVYIDEYQDYSDNDGDYLLSGVPSGSQVLHVEAGSFVDYQTTLEIAEGSSTTQNVTMTEANEPTEDPREGEANIYGRIYDSNGAGVSGANVYAFLQGGGIIRQTATPTPTPSESPTPEGSAETDSYGTYQILNVEPGTYNLIVQKSGYETTTGSVIATANENNRVDTIYLGGGPSPTVSPTSTSTVQPTVSPTSSPGTGTTWVSETSSNEDAGPAYFSRNADVSNDGSLVVFESNQTNLKGGVSGSVDKQVEIYLWNSTVGTLTRISKSKDDGTADGDSRMPRIAGGGGKVVFYSSATTLVDNDTNGVDDVFLYDVAGATNTRISRRTDGTQTTNQSQHCDISDDGRYVTYQSEDDIEQAGGANVGVAGDPNIYLFDLGTGATPDFSQQFLVSHQPGNKHNGPAAGVKCTRPRINGEGNTGDQGIFIAYQATDTGNGNLVTGLNDNNTSLDVFRWSNNETTLANKTKLVSTDDGTLLGDAAQDSKNPSIDEEGMNVAFESSQKGIGNPADNIPDIFVRKYSGGGATTVYCSGISTNKKASHNPGISADGAYVAFHSLNTYDEKDTNDANDVYVNTVGQDTFVLISQKSDGESATGASTNPQMGGNDYVVFESVAQNLVSGSYFVAGTLDVFLRKWK